MKDRSHLNWTRGAKGFALHVGTARNCKHPDERNKIVPGLASGAPTMRAPMNDLLGLWITEGIEDGSSVLEAAGCGAGVAASAHPNRRGRP